MTRIYLIRHAQSEGNLYRRILGWYDGHLTKLGQQQAAALTQRFQNIPVRAIYTSDLSRASETAQALSQSKNRGLWLDPALREIDLGELTNIPYGDLTYHAPELYDSLFSYSPQWSPRGGETFLQVAERMTHVFMRVVDDHPDETVAIFSHAMAIRCLQAALRGKHPSEISDLPLGENTAVSCYDVKDNKFRILFENDTSHLSADLLPPSQESGESSTPLVWFRAMGLSDQEDIDFYRIARQDAWMTVHGSLQGFDGIGFLTEAREQLQWDPHALQQVMLRGRGIGLLQLNTLQDAVDGVGYIPFFYLRPDYRGQRIGAQLLGQAISVYQPMGRTLLRLLCDPQNIPAQRFYRRYGFTKTGEAPGALRPLDVLEMPLAAGGVLPQ